MNFIKKRNGIWKWNSILLKLFTHENVIYFFTGGHLNIFRLMIMSKNIAHDVRYDITEDLISYQYLVRTLQDKELIYSMIVIIRMSSAQNFYFQNSYCNYVINER